MHVASTLTLTEFCREKGLVLINYAMGYIFEKNEKHAEGFGIMFKEFEKGMERGGNTSIPGGSNE